jgi:branched-chain amino acid transport system permease protein
MASVVINGILLGLIYTLFALGLTISLGVMKVFNVAYGTLITFAVAEAALRWPHAGYGLVVLVGIGAGAIMGAILELVTVTPLQRRDVNTERRSEATLLTTLAAWFILTGIIFKQTSGGAYETFPQNNVFLSTVSVGSIHVEAGYLIGAGVAIVVVALTWLGIEHTQAGRSVRAIAANGQMAELLGINVRRYSLATAAITGALAGLAGVILATLFISFQAGFGDQFLVRGFEIVVVAGIGSILGTLIGGMALGLTEALLSYYGGSAWTTAGGAIIVAVIIFIRPNGLFGRKEVDRA